MIITILLIVISIIILIIICKMLLFQHLARLHDQREKRGGDNCGKNISYKIYFNIKLDDINLKV